MYAVTGAGGFIGGNLVRHLAGLGIGEVLAVDDLEDAAKRAAVARLPARAGMDLRAFRELLRGRAAPPVPLRAICHQGACADTLQTDRAYVMDRNFEYSREVLAYCLERELPLVYASSASVYGTNRASREEPVNEHPLNLYAESKLAFDEHVRRFLPGARATLVGLRYFNVYGPGELHKGRMASMAFQIFRQLRLTGKALLFGASHGFGPGEQRRDFVHVDDVARVNAWFLLGAPRQGIFNVGTGVSRSFNAVARAAMDLLGGGKIEYIPFPPELADKYQDFTEADLVRLRACGYGEEFIPLEQGMARARRGWDLELGAGD